VEVRLQAMVFRAKILKKRKEKERKKKKKKNDK